MTTTTWKIVNLEHNAEDGGFITAHWTVQAQLEVASNTNRIIQ